MNQIVRLITLTCVFCVVIHSSTSESISEAPATEPTSSLEPTTNSPTESPARVTSDKPEVESQRAALKSLPRATGTNDDLHAKNDGKEQLTAQDRQDDQSLPIDLSEYGFTQDDWVAAEQTGLLSQDTQPETIDAAGSETFDSVTLSQNPPAVDIQEGAEQFSLTQETLKTLQQSLNATQPDFVLEKAMDDWIEEALSSEDIDWTSLLLQVLEKERGETSTDADDGVVEESVLASQLQDEQP